MQEHSIRWRIARVDRGAVRAIPASALGSEAGDGDPGSPDTSGPDHGSPDHSSSDTASPGTAPEESSVADAAQRTWHTSPHGTLPTITGEPVVPAVGDWVVAQDQTVRVLPRTAELVRDSAGTTSREQVIAANVDTVLIAEPLEPLPALGRIERLLTIAYRSGARPVVLLTKVDRVADADYWAQQAREVAPGVPVLATSATTGLGTAELRQQTATSATLVIVGPSGAGKSTLVNALVGSEVMQTGQTRADSRGMHTTTHRELVPLGNGQVLIDTPGLRSIGLVATEESVAETFGDVTALAAACRFSDCQHDHEPGCAVQRAIEEGDLPQRRLDSWRSLHAEAQRQRVRADARLQAERKKQYKRNTRASRAARGTARRR